MSEQNQRHPGERFTGIFSAFMVYCILVWLWSLGLFMVWPWQKGGEWLPDYPLAAVCANDEICAIPYGELTAAKASGKVKTLELPEDAGETAIEMISVRWKRYGSGYESKASSWNFQTIVRYRLVDGAPVLDEYQEVNGKVFLYAMVGAAINLAFLFLRKWRRRK